MVWLILSQKNDHGFCTLWADRISRTVFTNYNMNRRDKFAQDLEVCRKKPRITPSNECSQAQNSYTRRDSACGSKMHFTNVSFHDVSPFVLALSTLCAWDRAEISNNALAPPLNNGSSQWVPILGRKWWKCAAKMELKGIWCQRYKINKIKMYVYF